MELFSDYLSGETAVNARKTVVLLIKFGADLNIRNNEGKNILL